MFLNGSTQTPACWIHMYIKQKLSALMTTKSKYKPTLENVEDAVLVSNAQPAFSCFWSPCTLWMCTRRRRASPVWGHGTGQTLGSQTHPTASALMGHWGPNSVHTSCTESPPRPRTVWCLTRIWCNYIPRWHKLFLVKRGCKCFFKILFVLLFETSPRLS